MLPAFKNGNLSVELNYATLAEAMEAQHPLWLCQCDEHGHSESIELTLEQAVWLRDTLAVYTKLLSASRGQEK